MSTDIDLEETKLFLSIIAPDGNVTFQTFDDNKGRMDQKLVRIIHGATDENLAKLKRLNHAGAGIFVTINRTDLKGRKKENIVAVRAVYVDLDEDGITKLSRIESNPLLKPRLVVESSPGKYHVYWFLDGELPLNDFKIFQKHLITHFGGDPIVNDLPRVLRLPGFFHQKGEPFRTRIIRDNKDAKPFPVGLVEKIKAKTTKEKVAENSNRNSQINSELLSAANQTVDIDRLQSALKVIPADSYDIWLKVIAGIKETSGDTAEAKEMARRWSESSDKYDSTKFDILWASLRDNHPAPVTVGTIFHIAQEYGWEEETTDGTINLSPQPLRRSLPDPPNFPLDALPPVMRDAVNAVVEIVQVPPALAGQSALAAATLAVQGRINVSIDGRVYPTSNFFITVAESGERKSAIDRIFLIPHQEQQSRLASLAASQRMDFEIQHGIWKSRCDKLVKNSRLPAVVDLASITNEIGREPIPPRDPLFLVEEPTYEGLIKLLENSQPSAGLYSDEGGRLMGGHSMNEENKLKTITGLSKIWDGDPITRSRSGDGNTILYNRRCSMHLMIQPTIMSTIFSQKLLIGQGFMSRILCSFPTSTIGTRRYRESDLSQNPDIKAYTYAIKELISPPLPIHENNPAMGLKLPTIEMSAEAKQVWIQFHDRIESGLREDQSFSTIRGFAAKAAEHVLRISAVFSLIGNQQCTQVGVNTMVQAIKLIDYYLLEALRLFGQGNDSPQLELAEKCLKWCQQQKDGIIELTHLYQKGPNPLRTRDNALRALKILHDHGWVNKIDGGMTIEGKHHNQVWRVVSE